MAVQIRDHLPPRPLTSHDNPKRGQQLKSIASRHLPAVQIFALPTQSSRDAKSRAGSAARRIARLPMQSRLDRSGAEAPLGSSGASCAAIGMSPKEAGARDIVRSRVHGTRPSTLTSLQRAAASDGCRWGRWPYRDRLQRARRLPRGRDSRSVVALSEPTGASAALIDYLIGANAIADRTVVLRYSR
jgi:hypothetical protein